VPLLGVPMERLQFERVSISRCSTVIWWGLRLRMRFAALGQVVEQMYGGTQVVIGHSQDSFEQHCIRNVFRWGSDGRNAVLFCV
jgi:hypothetical protein